MNRGSSAFLSWGRLTSSIIASKTRRQQNEKTWGINRGGMRNMGSAYMAYPANEDEVVINIDSACQ